MTEKSNPTTRERSHEEDRFYVAHAKHATFQEWGKDEASPLMSLKDAFVFAAAVGWAIGRRAPLGKRQHVGFWRSFDQRADVPILQAIAIAETGDPACIADQGSVIMIAEEYANGGIDEIVSHDRGDRERTLVALASMLTGEPHRAPAVATDEGSDDLFESEP